MTDLLIISLHADPSMPPGIGVYGGGHMYPKELLIGLSDKDYNVSLLTRKSYENLPNVESINTNCKIYRLDYGTYGIFDKRELYNLREKSYKLANKVIEDYHLKFQIIHSIYWNSGQLALQLGQKYGVPFVHSTISNGKQIQLRGAKEIEPNRIDVESKVFHVAKHLFCITVSEKQAIIKYYHIPDKKISVIGRPVNQAYRFPVHNDLGYTRNVNWKDSPYLLPLYRRETPVSPDIQWWKKQAFSYVGRIDLNKGIDIIISAWYSLYEVYKEMCPPLWIIGGTPDEINDFHNKFSVDLQMVENSGKLIWWGTLDAEGISAIYLRTLAVIMHSSYEPGGRVSLEAMSEGVPVIATKCGFSVDMIIDWENGFLVDYGDMNMLAKRMEHFIWQPFLSYSLGNSAKNCAKKITEKWDFLASHINVYNKILYNNYKSVEDTIQEDNQVIPDYINVYPYVNFRMDNLTIRLYIENSLNIHNFTLKESSINKNHCFCWDILINHARYTLYQPYNYLNKNVFLQDKRNYTKVHLAADRYRRHKYWSAVIATDTLYCDDKDYLILCKKGIELDANENLSDIIEYIEQHSLLNYKNKNIVSPQVNSMLEQGQNTQKILEKYKNIIAEEPWYMEGNFSYCLESRIIIQALKTDKIIADKIGYSGISLLNNIAQLRKTMTDFVISGFVSEDATFYKEDNHLIIHNCEYLHPSWPGEDYAKLFLMLLNPNNISDAILLLNRFPETSHQDIILWSIIVVSKKIVFLHRIGASDEKFRKFTSLLDLLKELYTNLH
jgi:glycosyltransferase involved in cell wall biosynthesis